MRTNTKTVNKFYDSDTVNGWNLNYDYESENGQAPLEIRVNGQKGAASLYVNRSNGNTSINFNGGAVDGAVMTSITTEFDAIAASFEQA